MRKFIIILASVVTLLLVAAAFIPVVFKDDIQNGIQRLIGESIEAKVLFDASTFGLTLFKNFPNPTATIDNFGIIGTNEFEGDTLLYVQKLDLTFDLFSIFGQTYVIKSLDLVRPHINVLILENGKANYEIIKESSTEAAEANGTGSAEFNLAINQWNISKGRLSYLDKDMDLSMYMQQINHTGGGNLSLQEFDLRTITNIEQATIIYEGVNYLNGQSLFADAILEINIPEFKFTFKDNNIRVNDFPFSFDGYIAMPADDIDLDISFTAANSDIKSLYSLVPGVYTHDYESISAEGEMAFNGNVRGIYSETSIPAFNVALQVSNGKISYADLPTPIKNINMDMLVDCSDGVIESTKVEVKQFHMELGNNPIDGFLELRNLKDYSMKANVNASIKLSELSSIFPIEGTDLEGHFLIDLKVDGIYDTLNSIMPAISANMSLENGFIKSKDFPKAVKDVSFIAAVDCNSGKMEDMIVDVRQFKLTMENDELMGKLRLENLLDYQWELMLKGGLDLEILSEVYPVEGVNYKGHLSADIETKGKYSDVEAERYSQFPTKGTITLTNFGFKSDDLPQGMQISESTVSVDPQRLSLESFDAVIGRSDLSLDGLVFNHLNYLFGEDAYLKGNLNLTSNILDINEWITGEETSNENTEDSVQLEVIEIPRNINFEVNSSIKNIYYDGLNLKNAKGLIAVREGILDLSDLTFSLLDGVVNMNGKYDSRTPGYPSFNFSLDVKSLSIPQAFTSFSTIQAFAPMAKEMNGSFSTRFQINGLLSRDMSPVYESLNGKGLIQIAETSIKNSKLVAGISSFMKGGIASDQLVLKDVILKTSLENGRAHVAPFNVSVGGQKAQISGSIGADGTLDYYVNTEIEAGAVGQQVNQLLATIRGEQSSAANSKIMLNFNVAGTYENPKITLAGTTSADGTKNSLKTEVQTEVERQVESKVEEAKSKVEETAKDETTKLIEKSEEKLQEQLDTLKKEITKNLSEEAQKALGDQLDSTTNELQETIKNLFKKKKN